MQFYVNKYFNVYQKRVSFASLSYVSIATCRHVDEVTLTLANCN